MTVTTELALQALITAAFVLAALAIPKLLAYFFWALYKICVFKGVKRISRIKGMRKLIKGDLYEAFLQVSDDQSMKVKHILQTFSDYTRDVKEPLVEAIAAIILVLYISTTTLIEQPLLIFFQALAGALIIFIFISLLMVLIVLKEANKLKKIPQKPKTKASGNAKLD